MPDFPETLGPYVPERLLGRGAMARVYLCRGPDNQAVAVKWLSSDHPPLLQRFQREIEALRRLAHPGIVGYRDHGTQDGRPYLVMELVEGPELRGYARKLRTRPPAERYRRCREIGACLARALAHLHAAGLVHRDVKPSNVLLNPKGEPVLTDLGIVKDLVQEFESADLTSVGLQIGTLAYAAPEQLSGGRVDHRADQFGLGSTLYFVLTAKAPFEGFDRDPMVPAPPASTIDPQIPDSLDRIIQRLMAAEPSERYPNCELAAEALALSPASPEVAVAGRQEALAQVALALQRAKAGEPLALRYRAARGCGLGWLRDVVSHGAARGGVQVIEGDCAPSGPHLLLLRADDPIPDGYAAVEVDLQPLGHADLRRTLVGAAPDTTDPAGVAHRLLQLSGGIDSLVLALISRYRSGRRLVLPTAPACPDEVADLLDDLDVDELEVLGVLALASSPVSPELIERCVPVPADQALRALAARALAVGRGGLWGTPAELVRAGVLARLPDPVGLRERVHSASAPSVAGVASARAGDLLRRGEVSAALEALRAQIARYRLVAEPGAECQNRSLLGDLLLDLGAAVEAAPVLADASALARAVHLEAERWQVHVLRARCSLVARPGDRAAAASALDRLLPITTGTAAGAARLTATLARAEAARASEVLGDHHSARTNLDAGIHLCEGLAPDMAHPAMLALAVAALEIGQLPLAKQLSQDLSLDPLKDWLARCVRAQAEGQPLPPAGALAAGLPAPPRLPWRVCLP